MTLNLSVLDQSLARSADQAANTLQETLQMAQRRNLSMKSAP